MLPSRQVTACPTSRIKHTCRWPLAPSAYVYEMAQESIVGDLQGEAAVLLSCHITIVILV